MGKTSSSHSALSRAGVHPVVLGLSTYVEETLRNIQQPVLASMICQVTPEDIKEAMQLLAADRVFTTSCHLSAQYREFIRCQIAYKKAYPAPSQGVQ